MIVTKCQKIEIVIPADQDHETIELQEGAEARVIIDGPRNLRLDAILSGEDARLEIVGAFFGIANEEQQIVLAVVQDALRTSCNVRFRSVLDGQSCSQFDGLIRMTERAGGAHARMSYRGMLLSSLARAMPTPRFEILTKQVASATHEAAVGTIDANQLFYLRSRGLSSVEAQKLIIEGFLGITVN